MKHKASYMKLLLSAVCLPYLTNAATTFSVPGESSSSSSSSSASSSMSVTLTSPSVILDPAVIAKTFKETLRSAKENILISSPFLSINSLQTLGVLDILREKVKAGVKVTVLTCPALFRDKGYALDALRELYAVPVNVIEQDRLHAKFVAIDKKAVLFGSFNWLSGSLDPKYRYYRLDAVTLVGPEYFDAVFPHAASIAVGYAAPKKTVMPMATFISSSDDLVTEHKRLIKAAKTSIEICSPALSLNMLTFSGLLDTLKTRIQRDGIKVTVYCEKSFDSGDAEADKARMALYEIGAEVVLKKAIHLKFIIADNDLYIGSDNLFASSARDSGTGYWRELGVTIPYATPQIAEIKRLLSAADTLMVSKQSLPQSPALAAVAAPLPPALHIALPAAVAATPSVIKVDVKALPLEPDPAFAASAARPAAGGAGARDSDDSSDSDISSSSSSEEEVKPRARVMKTPVRKGGGAAAAASRVVDSSDDEDILPRNIKKQHRKAKKARRHYESLSSSSSSESSSSSSEEEVKHRGKAMKTPLRKGGGGAAAAASRVVDSSDDEDILPRNIKKQHHKAKKPRRHYAPSSSSSSSESSSSSSDESLPVSRNKRKR